MISWVTQIQIKSSRQIMWLKESFCPFTRDALNFRQPKIYAAPHHPAAVITAPCDAPLYHSALLTLMLTGKAESAQITHGQERYM